MRVHAFLLALAVALALPGAASACSIVIEGAARHRNYDPLSQRARPALLPYDELCRRDPVPTEAEVRSLATAPAPLQPGERRDPAGLFAWLAYLRGDTAGVLLAEPAVMARVKAGTAPGVVPQRECRPGPACDRLRRGDLADLHMAGAAVHLELFVLTGERRWLDQGHAEANAASALNVEDSEKHGFDLIGQTIRSYVAILEPGRPLYPAGICAVEARRVCPRLYPVASYGDGYGSGWSTATLAALYDPDADPDTFVALGKHKSAAQSLVPFITWDSRQAILSRDATAEGAREVLVPVRHLLGVLGKDQAHLRRALVIVEAQLLARIARDEPQSREARALRTSSRRKLRSIAALKDQPALAWRAQRLLAAIEARDYPMSLFAF